MVPVSRAGGGLLGAPTPPNDASKYYIYSYDSGRRPDPNTKVLFQDEPNLNTFLDQLPDKGITLSQQPPDKVAELDASDAWKTWMTNWDANCALSITVDDNTSMNVQSFEFHLTTPYDLAFSSGPDALIFSLGTNASGIPPPGIQSDGSTLYFGLDPGKSKAVNTTIKDVFSFANLEDGIEQFPDLVTGLEATLDPTEANEKRNAIWFTPGKYLSTTIRLQFGIKDTEGFQKLLADELQGLEFTNIELICKKETILGDADTEEEAVSIGTIVFETSGSITPKGKTGIDIILGLAVSKTQLDLTINVNDPANENVFTDIIAWLLDLLPQGSGVDGFQTLLEKDDIFKDYIHLRRLRIILASTGQGSPKLSSVKVDVEVSGNFGNANKAQRAPFLVSYSWDANAGQLGSIVGDFWNWYETSTERFISPQYESFSDLQPLTTEPLKVLDLVTLIPGVDKIPDIPSTVPTEISSACIFLSQDTFTIRTTIESKDHDAGDIPGKVPSIDLGRIDLDASFSWTNSRNFNICLAFTTILVPSQRSKHKGNAYLVGDVKYDSSQGWQLEASLDGLYASTLCEFFDKASADHVSPFLDSLAISRMHLLYKYEKGAVEGRSVGSSFDFTGAILVANLELDLVFHFDNQNGWSFTADLGATKDTTTIGDILTSMLGDDDLSLPPFLADTVFNGDKGSGSKFHLEVQKSKAGFHLLTNIVFSPVTIVFAQIHANDWPASTKSKRLVKAGIVALPSVSIPLIGDLTQPFDEMYLLWVQDAANISKSKQAQPGLTVSEVDDLNASLGQYPLVYSNKSKSPEDTDVIIASGAHFCVVLKDHNNVPKMVLDYNFKRTQPKSESQASSATGLAVKGAGTDGTKPDSDGGSASAPFKKKSGPLSITNLGLKYANKKLQIMLTATLELGPVGLSLIGFGLNLDLAVLKKPELSDLSITLEGLSVAFERPPLTICGSIRHGSDPNLNYYAGGLIIGWKPYQIEAAGFYGEAIPGGAKDAKDSFISVFVFARVDGPLVELEFAEISGVSGGFGYNSNVKVPTPDQIVNFPFINTGSLDGATDSAMSALQRLTDPGNGGWFNPLPGTYWAAVGMKIDAFQLISLDAVAVVQFGETIKLGIYAVANVDIPNPKSPMKYAHAELGIAIVVDFAYGVMKAEAQLSPNSYILDPNCHLTGGFALYYWFDAPHADHSKTGEFVFSLGGYHPAFHIPEGYPNPPRLGISWCLGGGLSVTGEAYFAITTKACMGGGRLHAALSAGPLEAWFDAFANFLINYQPFHFLAEIGVDIGVKFSIDIWFIHIHISVDVGADLTMWGPPLAGRVHVNLKVVSFNVNFGHAQQDVEPVSLLEFYELVLQADQSSPGTRQEEAALAEPGVTELDKDGAEEDGEQFIDMPQDEAHTFLAESGLMNNDEKPDRKQNQSWLVRGGSFVCAIGCKVAINSADQMDGDKSISRITHDETIYARPMKLQGESQLVSNLQISIVRKDGKVIEGWTMEQVTKSLPAGLWGEYNSSTDPLESGNNISSLLYSSGGTIDLLAGVRLTAPPPHMSNDPYPVFNILDAELQELTAEEPFPQSEGSNQDWDPAESPQTIEQWEMVREQWAVPDWDQGTGKVQEVFVSSWMAALGWDARLSQWAKMPKWVHHQFDGLYVDAPLMTK
ncbi:putative transcriptional activator srcap-like protein [Metarhizium acridum CQMa 102]|uniref:Putative transcriptional activator srcap-like protein n=1 Tax=Metarhizium acridum (strain CQMa 102) TaxID=655827 RepID=E9EEA5_METAQ|nr:putative transcriptional activator srcap-like protein [Metarhizium acridum CQMa 102]EFY85733.1 putative transcriptional activator srcap-like protein [Metarhizium acridum CQMa 102]